MIPAPLPGDYSLVETVRPDISFTIGAGSTPDESMQARETAIKRLRESGAAYLRLVWGGDSLVAEGWRAGPTCSFSLMRDD